MPMYEIPTDGCNMEIMGYPFFAESISPNESFRRREYNYNNIVGGTMKVTPGAYVGLDFTATTHVKIDPDRPDEYNSIFQEMMSKPVEVISPEMGSFNAIVIVKPEHDKLDYLKVTFSIKEVPDNQSLIPGEDFTVPATRVIDTKKGKKDNDSKNDTKKDSKKGNNKTDNGSNKGSKKNKKTKKTKSKGK